jgi:four helix bundle protein
MLRTYRELEVWQKSYQMCLDLYRLTKGFPLEEKYGLTSQLRRAAVSVPSNIAEGYGRKTVLEYIRSLYVANGSVCELETQLMLARDLDYLDDAQARQLRGQLGSVERMLRALIRALDASAPRRGPSGHRPEPRNPRPPEPERRERR